MRPDRFTLKLGSLLIAFLVSTFLYLTLFHSLKFLPVQAAGESWLTGYSYRKQITIDNTKVSDLDSADFDNFPVLISLSGLSNINDGGTDIRFTTSDGATQLSREIESYSSGTGALVAWVKIPVLSYNSDTIIYMYYGKSGDAEPAANSTYGSQNVWTENYAGVWHLKETGTNPAVSDSTVNANNSTTQTWTPTAGQINGAGSFNGSSNSINIGSTGVLNPNFITVSAWAKADVNNKWQYIALKSGQWNFGRDSDGKYYLGLWNTSGAVIADIHSVAVGTTAVWQHVVFTYNGARAKYYVNTSLVIDNAVTGNLQTSAAAVNIGSQAGTGNYWDGLIDDVKIASVARTAGWIATEYNNQDSPSTFALADDQEEQPTPTPTPTVTPTPTPTATPAPTSTSSSNNSSTSYSTNTTSTPSCGSSKPVGKPDLFQIDATTNSATIYFTPVSGISKYYISYSTSSSAEEHGVEVNLGNEGVQNYTVNLLSPATAYYFKVRGQNGCMPGSWSDVKAAATKSNSPNFISTILENVKEKLIPDKKLDIVSQKLTGEKPNKATKEIKQEGIQLNVLVKDTKNNPLVGVTVTIHSKVQTAKTDKKGIARFKNVETGEHKVLLSYNEYKGEQKLTVDSKHKEQTLILQVQMNSGFFSPAVMIVVGIMAGIIAILLFVIFKKRRLGRSR